MDVADWIALGSGLVGAVLGALGFWKAGEANRIARAANKLSAESNTIAREANDIARSGVDHQIAADADARRAVLVVPDDGAVWTYNLKDSVARMGVKIANHGAAVARDVELAPFVDGERQRVERGTIARLSRDDPPTVRLLFHIPRAEWWSEPESKLIRLRFTYRDDLGSHQEDFCCRLSGPNPQAWSSTKAPCG